MRRTALLGVSLTLLMLLLVLGSAFIFLFQGRQQLVTESEAVSSSLSQTQQELDITYDTLDASGRALATAEATNLILEGQLVQSQQELDTISSNLATREAEVVQVSSERDQFLSQPPTIEIISPASDEVLAVGEQAKYDIVVADVVGVTAVLISIDDEQIDAFSLSGNPTERVSGVWTPTETGTAVLGIQASNSRTSILVTQTLTIELPFSGIDSIAQEGFIPNRNSIETAVSQQRELSLTAPSNGVNFVPSEETNGVETQILFPMHAASSNFVGQLLDLSFGNVVAPFESIVYSPKDDLFTSALEFPGTAVQRQYDYVGAFTLLLLTQNFGWKDQQLLNNDAWLAQFGVAEGEMLVMQEQLTSLSLFEGADLLSSDRSTLAQIILDAGKTFVLTVLGSSGSYKSMDAVWNTLPQSTEQLLHPEKYFLEEAPISVDVLDLAAETGDEWEITEQGIMGEAVLRVYLSKHLNESQVETAASGWGGDRYVVYQNGETGESLLVVKILWDSVEDSNEFSALYPNYPTRQLTAAGILNEIGECWEGESVICLFQNGIETAVVRASSVDLALSIGQILFDS